MRPWPGDKKKGVSGEEGQDNKSGLTKNNQKQKNIRPLVVGLHELHQVLVDMQEEVNQKVHGQYVVFVGRWQPLFLSDDTVP